jgi:hypothetical protein
MFVSLFVSLLPGKGAASQFCALEHFKQVAVVPIAFTTVFAGL